MRITSKIILFYSKKYKPPTKLLDLDLFFLLRRLPQSQDDVFVGVGIFPGNIIYFYIERGSTGTSSILKNNSSLNKYQSIEAVVWVKGINILKAYLWKNTKLSDRLIPSTK